MDSHRFWAKTVGSILLALTSCAAIADAGRIAVADGTATVIRGGEEYRAVKDALLQEGDVIKTEQDSKVQWRLADDSLYTMGPGSELQITEFFLNRKAGTDSKSLGRLALNLLKGGFRSISGFIGTRDQSAYSIRTPAATMGIRGTDYTILHVPAEVAAALGIDAGTYVKVHTGAAIITAGSSGNSLVIEAGGTGFVGLGAGAQPTQLPFLPAAVAELFNAPEFQFDVEFFEQIDVDIRIERESSASPS